MNIPFTGPALVQLEHSSPLVHHLSLGTGLAHLLCHAILKCYGEVSWDTLPRPWPPTPRLIHHDAPPLQLTYRAATAMPIARHLGQPAHQVAVRLASTLAALTPADLFPAQHQNFNGPPHNAQAAALPYLTVRSDGAWVIIRVTPAGVRHWLQLLATMPSAAHASTASSSWELETLDFKILRSYAGCCRLQRMIRYHHGSMLSAPLEAADVTLPAQVALLQRLLRILDLAALKHPYASRPETLSKPQQLAFKRYLLQLCDAFYAFHATRRFFTPPEPRSRALVQVDIELLRATQQALSQISLDLGIVLPEAL